MTRPKWQILKECLTYVWKGHPTEESVFTEQWLNHPGKLERNVQGERKLASYARNWLNVHQIFKYRIALPLLQIMDTLFGHLKPKQIPNTKPNYLLRSFERAWYAAENDWFLYDLHKGKYPYKSTVKIKQDIDDCEPVLRLRSMKDWMMGVLVYDQRYKEFFSLLMIRLHLEHLRVFKDRFPNHLLYNAMCIDDPKYFKLFDTVWGKRTPMQMKYETTNDLFEYLEISKIDRYK